jgi:hypothetical protein
MTNPEEKTALIGKRKAPEASAEASAVENPTKVSKTSTLALTAKPHEDPMEEAAPPPNTEITPVDFSRLIGQANPELAQSMRDAGELGYGRSDANQDLNTRSYSLDPAVIRARITAVLTPALTLLYREHGNKTLEASTAQATTDATVTADACMAAIYARLRNINKSFNINPTRYPSHPTFPKECELPLPFAIAIENIGMFATEDVVTKVLVVPAYPENTQNEGRSAATWSLSQYYSAAARMKELNIPFKKVNVMNKTGSPWWTFKPIYNHGRFDLRCIFPPMMYSALAVSLATLFLSTNAAQEAVMIYTALADDAAHPLRACDIQLRDVQKTLFALCNFPAYYWSDAYPGI